MAGFEWPDGKRFAFTILDDTDVATVENVRPIYRLFESLGLRTTKTVWSMPCPEGSKNFWTSQTLEDPDYREFTVDLQRRGFEIASHGATMESSPRERTEAGLERFRALFGTYPRVHVNHSYNRENLYWGAERLDDPLLRWVYGRTNGQPAGYYQGSRPGSPWWWGDLAAGRITYARNLTFRTLNLARINPSMPYRDPRRPMIPWWFSGSDAEGCAEFNQLVSEPNQARLEAEGGFTIVATHLGKQYVKDGRVDPTTTRLLERLAVRPGWFPTVSELLDWLRARRAMDPLPSGEWRRMQWVWGRDLAERKWSQWRQGKRR